eukprot:gene14795-16329_t
MADQVQNQVASILRNALQDLEAVGTLPSTPSPTPTPSTSSSNIHSAERDFRNAFPGLSGGGKRQSPFNPPKKRQRKSGNFVMITPKETWTHDFCVLNELSVSLSPTLNILSLLKEAGLERKKITFQDKNADHQKVCQTLEEHFPKLKSQHGAFEMLRAEKGGVSQKLSVLPLSAKGFTIPYLKEIVSNNTLIYVRPMQSALPMSKVVVKTDEGITSKCQRCSDVIPLSSLREHMNKCQDIQDHSVIESAGIDQTKDNPDDADDIFSFHVQCPKISKLPTAHTSTTQGSAIDTDYQPKLPEFSVASTSTSNIDVKWDDEDHSIFSSVKWDEELSSLFPSVDVGEI